MTKTNKFQNIYHFLIKIYRWASVMTIMFVFGTITLLIVLLSFGLLRNFCVKYISKYISRFIILVMGYHYELPDLKQFPKHQVLYTLNHNSHLDIFLLTALGLSNTRFILSEKTIKYIPLFISAKAIGTFYIPTKKYDNRRLKFFIKTTSFLKKTNYSIIASPEGARGEYARGIYPFNKGIFHMALEAKIPIVPLYIHIPEEINTFTGEYSKGGKVYVKILDEIDNSNWKLETIWDEIAKVRKIYVDKYNELNSIKTI